jgi:methyl-accepting chemotaxis protein
MAEQSPLRDRSVEGAPGLALRGRTGTTRFTASTGREALGGYAPAIVPGWSADVRQDTAEAFAPIYEQRNLAIAIALLGSLLVIAFAVWFARRTVAPVKELAANAQAVAGGDLRVRARPRGPDEVRGLGESFNGMVASLASLAGEIRAAGADMASSSAELSSAAQELAATTTQQSAAATQTSSTMEELAQTSARIADSVDVVAQRTMDTQAALGRADEGIAESGERLASLAERAGEIDRITALINELADRTNLLALNAAIEAARAGEAGAGFAVVAEEVRLLAERSKNEAAKIAEIVQRSHHDTSSAARAMERGSTDMRHGVALMDEVADSTSEVRLTTDQQRVATGQVVETMLSVSSATKQTASTAQQIASASGTIADLAARLRDASSAFVTRGDGDPVRHVAADAWPPAEPPAPPPWPPAGGSVAAPAASWGTAANGHGHGHGGGLADGGNGHAAGEVPHPRP